MYFNHNFIEELEEKQYITTFSSNFWDYNFTKNNYNIDISKYRKYFKKYDEYFNIYQNDYREAINIKEFYLLMTLTYNNPNTLFHSLFNYLPLTRFKNYGELVECLNNLEIRGYIKIDRNHDVKDLYRSYNARKQFIVKIYSIDIYGKSLTLSYSQKKKQNKIKLLKRKLKK